MPYRDERRALETRQNLLEEELTSVRARLMGLRTGLVARIPHRFQPSYSGWGAYFLALCVLALVAAPAVAYAGLVGARALSGAPAHDSQQARTRGASVEILDESEVPNRPSVRHWQQDVTW